MHHVPDSKVIERILFTQQAGVMSQQMHQVSTTLAEALPGCSVTFATKPEDVIERARFDAIIAPTLPWLPELLMRIEGTPWLHFLSAGVDKIWPMAVDWSRYQLTASQGVHAIPISEYVLGAMLHFAKRLDQFSVQSRGAVWQRTWLTELTDAKLVMVGAGSIGREIARRGRLFGMHVTPVARTGRQDPELGRILPFSELATAVATADYLVVAVPLTKETRGLVGSEILGSLKRGAVLIDVSRGGVVSEEAIVRALDQGYLRGVALDVFETEPLDTNSALWRRDNVLITPHVAGTTPRYMDRALQLFLTNAQRLQSGQPMATPVEVSREY